MTDNNAVIQNLKLTVFCLNSRTQQKHELLRQQLRCLHHDGDRRDALTSLCKGHSLTTKRATFLSLLSLSLLHSQRMVKTIIHAILGLTLNDAPSNLAAATLLYLFTIHKGQDSHLLQSSASIRFEVETHADYYSEILICGAIFSETSGPIWKTSGNFKEKLRELGGLDAVFEIALKCQSELECWMESGFMYTKDLRYANQLKSLTLLLKCLKIMENATFLSKENQTYLLGLKRKLSSQATSFSFVKLVITLINFLSDVSSSQNASATSNDNKQQDLLLTDDKEKDAHNRSRLAAVNVIQLLCTLFLANQGEGEEAQYLLLEDGEKEAGKMILEAYSALLLAFLSTESKSVREAIAGNLPHQNLSIFVPVLNRFVEFHSTLNMISPETHKTICEVIESCRFA
ncbi:hypothetical protein RJT34_13963 [Clitoria ternatea]|uniref:Wings apart-like protein C-terminal domain-containing protein n=1 Tax=Clitoria ternatea TaxID=43366 RepID=A0AAN9PM84_CLITE